MPPSETLHFVVGQTYGCTGVQLYSSCDHKYGTYDTIVEVKVRNVCQPSTPEVRARHWCLSPVRGEVLCQLAVTDTKMSRMMSRSILVYLSLHANESYISHHLVS